MPYLWWYLPHVEHKRNYVFDRNHFTVPVIQISDFDLKRLYNYMWYKITCFTHFMCTIYPYYSPPVPIPIFTVLGSTKWSHLGRAPILFMPPTKNFTHRPVEDNIHVTTIKQHMHDQKRGFVCTFWYKYETFHINSTPCDIKFLIQCQCRFDLWQPEGIN